MGIEVKNIGKSSHGMNRLRIARVLGCLLTVVRNTLSHDHVPGPEGSPLNHKKNYCHDGVKQLSRVDEVPPWPQPQGTFTAGKMFHPQAFYVAVQDIYEQYCKPSAEPPPFATMEPLAFVKLLSSRIRTFDDGSIGFHLFADYELSATTPSGYIIHSEDGSGEWLRLAYLQGGIY